MTTWERVLAITGAVASIIALMDSLLFKSQLALALSIPPTMPTGLTAIAVLLASCSVLLALRRISSLDRKLGEAEARSSLLLDERSAALIEIEKLRAQVSTKNERPSDLEDRVYAVLVRKETSAIEILHELELDRSCFPDVIGAIASLVRSDRIEGGSLSTNYRVKRR